MSDIVSFERIEVPSGPRALPAWARDLHVAWRHGWGNRPDFKVRCRTDPLAFSDPGNPVWERRGKNMWIAECDGVAAIHYHSTAVSKATFTRQIGGKWDMTKPQLLDGKPWVDTAGLWPDQIASAKPKMGGTEHETYTMLATPKAEGYGGRCFDIMLKDGTPVKLRGPWHGGAPDGYHSILFDTDEHIMKYRRPGRWYKPWHAQGGFFGLYVTTQLLTDLLATFQPHLELAFVDLTRGRRYLEPLVPATGRPKGDVVPVDECPGHEEGAHGFCAYCHLNLKALAA